MKDHYRPQKMALWMNLIPDLQSAAIANQVRRGKIALAAEAAEATDEAMLDYRLFFFRTLHIFSFDKSTSLKAFSLTIASQVFQYLGKKNTILMKNSVEVNVNHFILFLLR